MPDAHNIPALQYLSLYLSLSAFSCQTNMASSSIVPSQALPIKPSLIKRTIPCYAWRVRAQSNREDWWQSGKYRVDDANMRVLKGRMDEVRMKERLERCYRSCKYGWNYTSKTKQNQKPELSECFELVFLVGGIFGSTCFIGAVLLFLLSLLLHFS